MDANNFVNLAIQLKNDDVERDKLFEGSEKMVHNDWSLPAELQALQWIHKVKSTDPSDAVSAGTRVLSNLDPRIHYLQRSENPATKDKYNEWERQLLYWLMAASRRRRASVVRDVVRSSLVYDSVAANVISLDYQIKLAKRGLGGDEKRWQIARQNGPFAVLVRNPKNIHSLFTDLQPEAVYSVTKHSLYEARGFWGAKAGEIDLWLDGETPTEVYVHDVTTLDHRFVFMNQSDTPSLGVTLVDEEQKMPFFPWVVRAGGTNIETDREYQYEPLLASVHRSGQWDTQNMVETIFVSDIIARAAKAKGKKMGPNPDSVQKDYNEPGGDVMVPAGHDYQVLPEEPIDQGMLLVKNDMQSKIAKSTVAQILQGADVPSGTAFATLNLATQTAIGALKPYKELAELALGDILMLMCRWASHMGNTIVTTGRDPKTDLGKVYTLDPKDIDVNNLDITVELTPDVPTDRQQRINAAIMATQQMDYSMESALEDIGVTDPQREMKRRRLERFERAVFDRAIRKLEMEDQLEYQNVLMQMQMQNQMSAQQAMQEQQQAQIPMDALQQGPPTGAEGQGFNPAMGGQPAQMMAPEATYEGQTGETREGEEVY